ncbi:hypothetical protein DUI87_13865 [Hirundo rustica rustica]|uniref:Uncharacterized protein n=1 Tax=Hirundo rustica rustica TaxID=333673 RepID=A0A3M0K8J6_HIRRU|nr:hypothetical protein DUI87_13865 [Hirundo rustica rustica]
MGNGVRDNKDECQVLHEYSRLGQKAKLLVGKAWEYWCQGLDMKGHKAYGQMDKKADGTWPIPAMVCLKDQGSLC